MTHDSLEQFMRHVISMRRLTTVELVNTYWQQANHIADTGRLGFIIRGNVSWESDQPDGIFSNALWLKTNRFDPIGKHIATEPLRTYLQWYMNLYEIWGTMNIEINPNDARISKPIIEEHLEKITSVTNAMSLLFGASLRWIPARYALIRHTPLPPFTEREEYESWDCIPLQRSQDEQIAILLKDEAILHKLIPLVNTIEKLPPVFKPIIYTSLDWHASANRFSSGLNRFLNYWSSVELLGNYFYKRLCASVVQRKTRDKKREEILSIIEKGVTYDNCMKAIQDCNEIREPSARTRILAFLGIIANQEQMEEALFIPDEKSGKSLYQIRNEIGHGYISERDFEKVEVLRHRLLDARNISRDILIRSITSAKELLENIE